MSIPVPSAFNTFSALIGTSFPKNIDGTYKLTDRYNFRDSWKELEVAYSQGKCRAIGVSNFSIKTYVMIVLNLLQRSD